CPALRTAVQASCFACDFLVPGPHRPCDQYRHRPHRTDLRTHSGNAKNDPTEVANLHSARLQPSGAMVRDRALLQFLQTGTANRRTDCDGESASHVQAPPPVEDDGRDSAQAVEQRRRRVGSSDGSHLDDVTATARTWTEHPYTR